MADRRNPLPPARREQYGLIRDALRDHGFTEASAARRLAVTSLYEYASAAAEASAGERAANLAPADPLNELIRAFLLGETRPPAGFRRLLGDALADALFDAGLLEMAAGGLRSPVQLNPVEDLLLISDPHSRYWRDRGAYPEDAVFSPLTPHVVQFLEAVPRRPAGRVLDLGTGCGVAALIARREGAREVWGVDLNERAIAYACANAQLNNCDGVHFRAGDLYEPVKGLTFERIVFHPPYDPVPRNGVSVMFAHSGVDGELLTRLGVAAAPAFLEPGGRMYISTMIIEAGGQTAAEKVAGWFGAAAAEMNVVLAERERLSQDAYAVSLTAGKGGTFDKVGEELRRLREAGISGRVGGALVVERRRQPGPAWREMRVQGPDTRAAELDWMLDWQERRLAPDARELLLASRPRLNPALQLSIRYGVRDGELEPASYRLETDFPLSSGLDASRGVVLLLNEMDGQRTGAELAETARAKLGLDSPERFTAALEALVTGGFVEIEAAPFPPRKPRAAG
jgi:methylase of polypeptide subunit release factors